MELPKFQNGSLDCVSNVLSTMPSHPTNVQVDNKNNCIYANLEYVETMLLSCG